MNAEQVDLKRILVVLQASILRKTEMWLEFAVRSRSDGPPEF